ncbi:fimbrial-like adhesin protein [Escherichia coli]|uniref:Fimbrial-like adhesin protein n=1 Tax=Escherichia coli TaxID=562 RepID=A0AAX2K5F6_ECOLX|nr:fimbrial-like adhesin protein [Escherichia coli]
MAPSLTSLIWQKWALLLAPAATGVGIRIDDAESGNLMPLNAMGNDNTVYQIPADSNGIVNVDLIAYYVSTVEASEITPGEADAVVNVTLDYR